MSRYLVASSGNNLDAKVSGRFGHAKYYIVVDPQIMKYEVYPGIDKDEERECIERFMQHGIDKVLVGNVGPSAFDDITAKGLKIYLCRKMLVKEAVQKVYKEEIPQMQSPTLEDSIHSARKAKDDDNYGGEGRGRGGGRGLGRGMGEGQGRSAGGGRGLGRGTGKGRGKGSGRGQGRNNWF
ncbi:MAG: NifB/NifX family molybdenum-iron cluster-binding protein [Bacteroidota bacterium]|nr:NifB/NifX family molybdenum-iron cluster-binding protein [Bacteroidota bacterium]